MSNDRDFHRPTPHRSRLTRALAGSIAAALVLAACSQATPEPTPTPTAEPTAAATPESVLVPAEPAVAAAPAPTPAAAIEAAAAPTPTGAAEAAAPAPAEKAGIVTAGTFVEDNGLCGLFIGEEIPAGLAKYLRCGYYTVPELHTQPDGEQIKLPVVVVKSASPKPSPDPLLMLQGGPGGSGIREFFNGVIASGFSPGDDRDLILVDQRGSLLTQPALTCPEYREVALKHIASGLMGEAAEQERLAAAQACRQRLADAGVNLAAYNSFENAADIAGLPLALGYVNYNIYGKSYGALLAQHILALHPRGVRSVILDGAIPRQGRFALNRNANFQQALQKVAQACAADAICGKDYPDIAGRFIRLVAELNASPAPMTITTRSFTQTVVLGAPLTGEALLTTIYTMMYDSYGISRLPRLVDLVEKRDLNYLSRLRDRFELQVLNETTIGMFNSIFCSEEADFTAEEAQAADVDVRPELQVFRSAREILATCKIWDVPALGPEAHTAAASDIPALVLNGEFDPLTPPEFGQRVAAGLSKATQVLFKAQGHGQAPANACASGLIANFLNAPAVPLDTSCAQGSAPLEFSTVSIVLTDFTDPGAGVGGKRPIGWTRIAPGVFADDVAQAVLTFEKQEAADLSAIQRQLATGQFRRTETLRSGGQDREDVAWQLFTGSDGKSLYDIAIGNEGRYIVQLITADATQREALYDAVFIPAVESSLAVQAPAQTIVIETPQADAEVTSPVDVSGYTSRTPFENTLIYRIYNSAGLIIGEGPINVKGNLGSPGTFAAALPFTVTQREAGRIEVVDINAADGRPFATAAVSVTLAPLDLEGQPPVFEIAIAAPAPNTAISSPAQVRGNISLTPFENNLVYRVFDAAGAAVGVGPITVEGDLGKPGVFDATLLFTPTVSGPGRVLIEVPNEATGVPFTTAAVDVVLQAPAVVTEAVTATQASAATLDPGRFSLNPAGVARRVTPQLRPAIPFNPNEPPPLNGWPEHIRFVFDRDRLEDDYFAPRQRQMLIFPLEAYRAQFSGDALAEFDAMIAGLKAILATRPATITETIPVLPTIGASQVLRSQIGYLDFDGGACVRFITAYRQDVGPITDGDTFYTCQGLSDDGEFYVSFTYPVSSTALPASARRVTRAEMARIEADPDSYLKRVAAALDQLPARNFRPVLTRLDAVVKSLQIR